MRSRRLKRLAVIAALLGALAPAGIVRAETQPVQPALPAQTQQDFSGAQYVQVTLGDLNQEEGLRLIDGQPDGLTEPLTQDLGRKSAASPTGGERFFYVDIHDTYVRGGINKVVMTVTYLDRGLTPFYIEYDSYDPARPDSTAEAVTRKRAPVATRTNSDVWKTERITLEDARFGNNQPGGADFRFGSSDELVIRNVSVLLVSHEQPQPPIRVVVDGKEVRFDVVPYVDPITNRTLVPMRAMFNALGVDNGNIAWDGAARRVTATRGQTTISLTIDQDVAFVNFAPVQLEQPAVIRADRTLVPLRFVSEQFGLKVDWNAQLRLITLTSPSQPKP